jgi:pimeloyl-ACP methyl ester carboxylesterase
LIHAAPEKFVSASGAPLLREAIHDFLLEAYPNANAVAARMSPEGQQLYASISKRDTHALGAKLLEVLPQISASMADCSPVGRIASIRVPIFLLHGAHDNVVPPSESLWTAKEARPGQEVHVLLSPKISHAELGHEDRAKDTWDLVDFMSDMLAE